MAERYLSLNQLANFLGVSSSTVRWHLNKGRLPQPLKVGKRKTGSDVIWLFDMEEINRALKQYPELKKN